MWTIHVRNPAFQRVAMLDDYQKLEAVKRLNRIGAWVLDLNASVETTQLLTQPGWGIEVTRTSDGAPLISGPMTKAERKRDKTTNTVTVFGVDDMIHLNDRLVHPQPATASPPYSVSEHDVRTGVCSTILRQYVDVNLGPSALGSRKVTGLTLASDPVAGSTVTGRGRWQNLLTFLEELALAGGGLAFDVRQSAAALQFVVWAPSDKSATVKFSVELGNLTAYEYSLAAPQASYIVCGGGGEGTARKIRERTGSEDVVSWGRRIEKFVDRRDTSADTELDQEITKALDEGKTETTVSFEPVDLPGMTYLDHYQLGDQVSAVVDDSVTELIREVKVQANPGATRITPSIGTPVLRDAARLFRRLRRTETRLQNLERR